MEVATSMQQEMHEIMVLEGSHQQVFNPDSQECLKICPWVLVEIKAIFNLIQANNLTMVINKTANMTSAAIIQI